MRYMPTHARLWFHQTAKMVKRFHSGRLAWVNSEENAALTRGLVRRAQRRVIYSYDGTRDNWVGSRQMYFYKYNSESIIKLEWFVAGVFHGILFDRVRFFEDGFFSCLRRGVVWYGAVSSQWTGVMRET